MWGVEPSMIGGTLDRGDRDFLPPNASRPRLVWWNFETSPVVDLARRMTRRRICSVGGQQQQLWPAPTFYDD